MGKNTAIYKSIEDNKVTIAPVVPINNDTAIFLSEELQNLDYNNLDLTIDLSKCEYITSAGLRVLLVARKKLSDDSMRVINANESIIDVFRITSFDSLIKIIKDDTIQAHNKLSYSSLLSSRVLKSGAKPAFFYRGKEYTWNDIDVFSSIIAMDLSNNGVVKGTHVGICGINSINWIFTFFAIQKLGGIAVLINPKLSPLEVQQICNIGGVTHFCYAEIPEITKFEIYSNACLELSSIKKVFDISDRIDFTIRRNEFENIRNKYRESYHPDDPSIIIFTSGSTGKPKAVLSSVFSISSSVNTIINNFKLTSEDVNLAFLPFFHIFGLVTNIIIGLIKGLKSVIPENYKPSLLVQRIDEYKCTMFNTVPTMMLEIIADSSFSPDKLSSLRVSMLGGSATTSEQMSTLMKLLPNTHFGNVYGMSENALIAITSYNDSIEHITKTVGKPISGIEISIRDDEGKEIKKGQGEILIKSDSMLVCYYNLDVDKQPIDNEGWLKTGDLGYIDEDGYIRLTGRLKDLIISGGENISPSEVAEVVSAIPCIRETKILGIPDELKGEVVVAAIVLNEDFKWDEKTVRAEVSKYLARYKQPVHYVVFDKLPLLGSGKIDTITLKNKVLEILLK